MGSGDEGAHRLDVGLAVGHEGAGQPKVVHRGRVHLHEHHRVDLRTQKKRQARQILPARLNAQSDSSPCTKPTRAVARTPSDQPPCSSRAAAHTPPGGAGCSPPTGRRPLIRTLNRTASDTHAACTPSPPPAASPALTAGRGKAARRARDPACGFESATPRRQPHPAACSRHWRDCWSRREKRSATG